MDRSSRQKINKETSDFNCHLDQMDLRDINRTFHLTAAEYTVSSNPYGMVSRVDHTLGFKASLNKFKKIGIISRSLLIIMV